jgi:tryptophan synthase alpha subunit
MVGFGVAERTIAEQVLHYADGVVVGSRFVKAIEEGAQAAELTALAHSIYGRE